MVDRENTAEKNLAELRNRPIKDPAIAELVSDLTRLNWSLSRIPEPHRGRLCERLEQAVDSLRADPPNVGLVRQLFNEVVSEHSWYRSALMRTLSRLGFCTPGHAALAGTLSAIVIVVLIAVLFLAVVPFGFIGTENEAIFRRELMVGMAGAAIMGAFASQIMLFRSSPPHPYDAGVIVNRGFFKPFLAVVFAMAVYAVLRAGIVAIPAFDIAVGDGGSGDASEIDPKHYYTVWVLGFLCGFSERFAPGIFDRTIATAEAKSD